MTSKLVVNTIEADTGISSVSFASSISMSSTSKFHFSAAGVDIGADTNINRPAAGVLAFNINSSEKARIASNGHVAIGTDSPNSALPLTIAGQYPGIQFKDNQGTTDFNINADSSAFRIQTGTAGAGPSEKLRIASDGKVGINQASPTTKLEVGGGSILVDAFNTSGDHGIFFRRGFNPTSSPYNLSILAYDHSGSSKDGLSINGYDGISFCTGSNTRAERLRITSSGKVNIGDTQMSQNILNIEDGTAAALDIASHGSGGDTAYIGVKKSSGGGLTIGISNRDIIFKTGATYSNGTVFDSGTERFRIRSDGKISTGTSINITNTYEFSVTGSDSNGAIYGHGRNHYLSNRSNAYASLTLKKSNSDSDATDYFQLRDSSNNLKGQITGAGNWKPIAGGGIDFSITGHNSGMTSELLDDYEEGAFVPTTNTGLTLQSSYNTFAYIKIGRCCTVRGLFYPNNNPSGNYTMTFSLPFTAYNYPQIAGAGGSGVMYRYISGATAGVAVYVEDGGSIAKFYKNGSSNSTWSPVYNSDWISAMEIYVDFTYFTV